MGDSKSIRWPSCQEQSQHGSGANFCNSCDSETLQSATFLKGMRGAHEDGLQTVHIECLLFARGVQKARGGAGLANTTGVRNFRSSEYCKTQLFGSYAGGRKRMSCNLGNAFFLSQEGFQKVSGGPRAKNNHNARESVAFAALAFRFFANHIFLKAM
jgi:hypothetical protein